VPPGLADRLVRPYVAAAKAALADGIVADADLVDAGAIFGTGFAPFRGGPLHYAASAAAAAPSASIG
jgi:3-hydroxyacyl-CoA dehydrogenase/enoyl-CoA hydratase/3-hydroxybutyryl-CoA epimerase